MADLSYAFIMQVDDIHPFYSDLLNVLYDKASWCAHLDLWHACWGAWHTKKRPGGTDDLCVLCPLAGSL